MTPLRYPVGDNRHRPFPHGMRFGQVKVGPEISDHLMVCGCGYWSAELSGLMRDFNRAQVVQACDELNVRPTRQNVALLRRHLEQQEENLK